jgi:hypothetical protein
MSCPICGGSMGVFNARPVLFTCGTCWWKLPAPDRMALGSLHRKKLPTAAKLESVVKKFKAKQAGGAS